ncbi:MAG: hypothetical protein VB096_00425 [Pseudoflavonifractor sp.]|nr:hypothetical protein [Pseudoflavonifractor sp.]
MSAEELLLQWPKGPDGEPEEAVLLETEGDFAGFAGIHCSMLESFGIPYLTSRSGLGQIGFIYGGFSPEGIRIYVPISLLETAQTLLTAAGEPAGEENKEEVL